MKICIHIVNIDDYFPELFKLTFQTVEMYAKRISADINIISERTHPNLPVMIEKLQVHKYGENYDWNLLMDADILVHPNTYNPFINFDPRMVGNKDEYPASNQLRLDKYFIRDGRNLGLSGCLLASSRLTHDLWEFPQDLTEEDILNNIHAPRKCVDEYVVSRNLAKYGLKYHELFPVKDYNLLYHVGCYDEDKNRILDLAKDWFKTHIG
jgi:hypothetical protein